ncbi:MAG: serine hydrolase [Cyanobacteria bacterium J06621_11]
MPAKFFQPDSTLQTQLEDILEETWRYFPELAQNQLAVTWIPYEPPYRVNTGGGLSAEDFWQYRPQGASYRGVELFVPGSLVHVFYLVALNVWLEQGMVQPSDEIERALTDMMVGTNHDAASYVVDVLSGTMSGPSLPPGPSDTWASQRNIVNRYFVQLGWPELRSINVNQKTWHSCPYGREHDFLGKALENQNQLTTEATARLLHSIVGGVSVSRERSQHMMDLLQATLSTKTSSKETVAAHIWEKKSLDESGAHSMAYVEAEDVHPYLLVVFSASPRLAHYSRNGHAQAPPQPSDDAISFIAEKIFAQSQQNFLQ